MSADVLMVKEFGLGIAMAILLMRLLSELYWCSFMALIGKWNCISSVA